jgi:hypothetical protein
MKKKKTKHHIIPRSRGGTDDIENIVYIPSRKHEYYHALFENRTPEEIISYLNRDFWRDGYRVTIEERFK